MRLIDADALKRDVIDLQDCYNGFSDTYDKACIIGVIDEQPTVKPERKKGEWIRHILKNANVPWGYDCTACGRWFVIGEETAESYVYCPNCGAEMRGEKDE